ncbi:MAG: hypothetical protein AB7S75_15380 [Desulfococcaceae bacterium]
MRQSKMIISLAVALVLGIAVQVILVYADAQDSPYKAATEFAKACFAYDRAVLSDRLCEGSKTANDADVVGNYIYKAQQEAEARGYSLGCYVKEKLYHLEAETVTRSQDAAQVRLTFEKRSPLRTFFSKKDKHDISHAEEVIDLVRENGRWKVCGNPFSIAGA